MITSQQITAALRELGPASPVAVARHLKVEAERHQVGHRMRAMLDEKTLTASGTSRGRIYALSDQQIDRPAAPPSERAPRGTRKKKRAKKAHRAPPAARTAERFIPTVDAELGLHIINGAAPLSFNPTQTEAIATLLFNHFKA